MKDLNKKRNIINSLFVLFAFTILTISYTSNPFNITDNNYRYFDRADEGNVMGRMILSKEKGIFSKGGLTGQYHSYTYPKEVLEGDNPPLSGMINDSIHMNMRQALALTYDNYINDREMINGEYFVYASQPGGQAITYSILQNILPFDGHTKLNIFRFLTVALSALAFALFSGWVSRNFGFTAGITTFMLILLSAGLYRFAFNLWWALWSFYIPFITLLLVLERREKKSLKLFDNKLLFILGLTIFIKFFFTGGEFITSTLVTSVCPIIFYLLWKHDNLKSGIIYFAKSTFVACAAVVLGLIQLAFQVKLYLGTWAEGITHVIGCFTRHAPTSEHLVEEKVKVLDILADFLDISAFYWQFIPFNSFGYGIFALIITFFSVFIYFVCKKLKQMQDRKNIALVLVTFISISGPLSWVFFFPSHIYDHPMFDFVTWYMPYCLFGFAVIGLSLNLVVNKIKDLRR